MRFSMLAADPSPRNTGQLIMVGAAVIFVILGS